MSEVLQQRLWCSRVLLSLNGACGRSSRTATWYPTLLAGPVFPLRLCSATSGASLLEGVWALVAGRSILARLGGRELRVPTE